MVQQFAFHHRRLSLRIFRTVCGPSHKLNDFRAPQKTSCGAVRHQTKSPTLLERFQPRNLTPKTLSTGGTQTSSFCNRPLKASSNGWRLCLGLVDYLRLGGGGLLATPAKSFWLRTVTAATPPLCQEETTVFSSSQLFYPVNNCFFSAHQLFRAIKVVNNHLGFMRIPDMTI